MAIIAIAMVTVSFSPGFDRYYPARVIVATSRARLLSKSYSELRLTWSWEAVAIGCGVFAFWIALEPLAASQSAGMPTRSGLESLAPLGNGMAVLSCSRFGDHRAARRRAGVSGLPDPPTGRG